jgi:hypothetical protein
MKGLTLIQKFDAVLEALYCLSGKRPTFDRINKFLRVKKKNVHWGEVWDILEKMQREFLVHQPRTHQDRPNEILHLITFEGKLMHERNGLNGKLFREKFTRIWVTALSILTLIIAFLSFHFSLTSVNDSTVKSLNDSIKQVVSRQDSMTLLETRKLKTLQNIADSVSKQKK